MFKDDGSVDYARSTCVSVSCTGDWPPVPVTGLPTVGTGLDANLASTITRPDGTLQVTYAGYPLYKWAGDFDPGDITAKTLLLYGQRDPDAPAAHAQAPRFLSTG